MLPSEAACRRAYVGDSTHPVVNFGSLKAPRDASIGTVLATRMLDIDDANCDVLAGQTFSYAMFGTLTALPSVYATNVGGVGVRVVPAADNGKSAYAPYVTSTLDSNNRFNQRQLKVELVKTGSIETGKELSGKFYSGIASAPGFGSDAAFSGGSFQSVSCTTQNVSVTLPTVSLSALRSGTVAGLTPFSIDIDCSGASMDTLSAIEYTLSNRTAILDPAKGAIALLPTSTSTGAALRLSDGNDLPVRFNAPVSLSGFNRTQTRFSVPLKAAYMKTGTPTPGTVETVVDFTLTYR
ncbi:fimbrial protein [Pseudomonas sp. Pseusp97]